MSCGQIALSSLALSPKVYYASEVDKHAIKQTQLNFPNTIQLGDVTRVDVSRLEPIDLLIGGSPCQSFSFAGKRVGMSTTDKEEIYTLDRYLELKEEGFQFEGESYLFWEYMRILTDIRKYNPNVLFLLENVEMGKKWERVLSEAIGVYGVHINSALVSAQNRKRIYWTNIRTKRDGLFNDLYSNIPQPADKGILLKDILEDEVDDKFYLSDKMVSCLASRKKTETFSPCKFEPFEFPFAVKSRTINQRVHKMGDTDNYVKISRDGKQHLEPQLAGKTNCLTSVQKDNLIMGDVARIRRLTPTECARLQTIPDWYKWECSDTQQYRMLGNGWTVDVIAHILSYMKEKMNINVA